MLSFPAHLDVYTHIDAKQPLTRRSPKKTRGPELSQEAKAEDVEVRMGLLPSTKLRSVNKILLDVFAPVLFRNFSCCLWLKVLTYYLISSFPSPAHTHGSRLKETERAWGKYAIAYYMLKELVHSLGFEFSWPTDYIDLSSPFQRD